MQNDQSDLQTKINELKKEIKEVSSQIAVFEKAETMQKQLEDEINSLSFNFEKLDGIKVAAEAFQNQFDAIIQMNKDAENRIEKFNTSKKQIDALEKSFNKLITLSGSMEDKIHELQATNDDLQSMEVKVREFQESLSTISMTYDRLDKKAEVINRVSLDVDTSFNQLKEMEQRLSFCSRQMQSLPEEIKDVYKKLVD